LKKWTNPWSIDNFTTLKEVRMKEYFDKNRENVITVAIISLIVIAAIVLLSQIPGIGRFMAGVWNVILWIFGIVFAIVILILTGFLGYWMPWLVDKLDEALGDQQEIADWLKVMLKIIVGFIIGLPYVFLVAFIIHAVPGFGRVYSAVIDSGAASLWESPLMSWGWILYGFIAYFVGWGIEGMVHSM
jgi:hypothetical protein